MISFLSLHFASLLLDSNLCLRLRKISKKARGDKKEERRNEGRKGGKRGRERGREGKENKDIKQERLTLKNKINLS